MQTYKERIKLTLVGFEPPNTTLVQHSKAHDKLVCVSKKTEQT